MSVTGVILHDNLGLPQLTDQFARSAARRGAIAGLGITKMGKVFGRTPAQLAAEAVSLAAADAGLSVDQIDGLLVSEGMVGGVPITLQHWLGLKGLRLLSQMQGFGSTAVSMVQYASMAIATGMANVVACVFADAPLREGEPVGATHAKPRQPAGIQNLEAVYGFAGATPRYALAARRHMETFGTTSEQFGAVAVAERQWASLNPRAQMRTPITLEDHQRSRWIVEPLHLLDCSLVSNGGVALIVTSADRARDLAQPPVYVWGWGQEHPGNMMHRGSQFGLVTGAQLSGRSAMAMAGVSLADIDICEIYDCYTYTVVVTLEDYGFCTKGDGGAFVASGTLAPGGSLPTNTGGGQLSGYYMWGMTPLSEAVIQARGQGGERQVRSRDVILVSGNGGVLDYHSTLIVSPLVQP